MLTYELRHSPLSSFLRWGAWSEGYRREANCVIASIDQFPRRELYLCFFSACVPFLFRYFGQFWHLALSIVSVLGRFYFFYVPTLKIKSASNAINRTRRCEIRRDMLQRVSVRMCQTKRFMPHFHCFKQFQYSHQPPTSCILPRKESDTVLPAIFLFSFFK